MESTLEQMARLKIEAEILLQKVADARENAKFFTCERINLDIACQRLESAVWALGQTDAGHVLGPAFEKMEAFNA
jgi:hypothetical protein